MVPTAKGLSLVEEFRIPITLLDNTLRILADVGSRNEEGFVLWGGKVDLSGRVFHFSKGVFPRQKALSTFHGLLVSVDGPALFSVNKDFYESGLTLAGQVHTHPTDAFHSETDDHYPLVTLTGSLSLVIPDFAREGRRNMNGWAWYRLAKYGKWTLVGKETNLVLET